MCKIWNFSRDKKYFSQQILQTNFFIKESQTVSPLIVIYDYLQVIHTCKSTNTNIAHFVEPGLSVSLSRHFEPSSGSVARINIKKGTSFNNFSTFIGSQSCPNKETKEIPTGQVARCILYAYKNAHFLNSWTRERHGSTRVPDHAFLVDVQ